ncbi:RING finger protein 141 [Liparis tanakae]|uniref:RING finger protein 141 n=1 Tax=Liparis tanakae TaxID=230148 RepID=A0A4Z2III3_9TELE|nr:RING finger protein 141 [Liparis tanakae]
MRKLPLSSKEEEAALRRHQAATVLCQHRPKANGEAAELDEKRRSARAVFISVAAAARMGQQLSGQAVMTRLPEKLVKHAGLVRDSGYLTYEEFLARVSELNDVRRSLGYAGVDLRLHGVHQEAELVAQRLVAVGHADLGHVGASDVVALRSVLQRSQVLSFHSWAAMAYSSISASWKGYKETNWNCMGSSVDSDTHRPFCRNSRSGFLEYCRNRLLLLSGDMAIGTWAR